MRMSRAEALAKIASDPVQYGELCECGHYGAAHHENGTCCAMVYRGLRADGKQRLAGTFCPCREFKAVVDPRKTEHTLEFRL